MSRCAYCKKQGAIKRTAIRFYDQRKAGLKTLELDYCSDTCKQNIHDFASFHNKYAPRFGKFALLSLFLFAIIPFSLRAITGNPFWVVVFSPAIMAIMGALLILFPLGLSNIKFYNRMGIKYTTWAIRVTGVLILASAIEMLWGALGK